MAGETIGAAGAVGIALAATARAAEGVAPNPGVRCGMPSGATGGIADVCDGGTAGRIGGTAGAAGAIPGGRIGAPGRTGVGDTGR
jgi:hypothetical protein